MPKGVRPPAAGKGRPKGAKNKAPGLLKDMILQSLANVGGIAYLERHAVKHPAVYLTLVGRVLPLQIKEGGQEPQMPKQVIHEFHET